MKTKIIYISGSEIFDMNDIRSAFDQVRNALSLGNDTVLFGVPVDRADALDGTVSAPAIDAVAFSTNAESEPISDTHIPTVHETSDDITVPVSQTDVPEISITPDVAETEPTIIETQPDTIEDTGPVEQPEPIVVKKSRGRPKSAKKKAAIEEPITSATIEPEPVSEVADTPNVVSILSVLTSKSAPDEIIPEPESDVIENDAPEITDAIASDQAPVIDELAEDMPDANVDIDITDDDTIEDMIVESAPALTTEKTLEQLLESMTPLREDIEHDIMMADEAPAPDFDAFDNDADDDQISQVAADTDATLEQLATEFAENQDKIATTPKTENHGKIGKLKNILPFKKARRDDSGLMGDLFGWAGVAANDEDFAIPGFFTNAASKK
ncbi:MAG: hypothetical protein NC311_00715 [Muribaculaceae bacterium]|nr:hypothetical protein [Muribaculaceae bacterium]